MNIVQLSPQFPFPATDGGKIGILNTTKALVDAGETVHMYCLTNTIPSEELQNAFISYTGAKLTCIQHDTHNSWQSIIRSLFDTQFPLYCRKHRSSTLIQAVLAHHSKQTIDYIYCDHTAMIENALAIKENIHIPVIVRLHNIEHRIWERYADRLPWFHPKKLYIQSQAQKLKQFEQEYYQKVDICCPITVIDQQYIAELSPKAHTIYIPPGIQIFPLRAKSTIINPLRMIHATTYSWVHNLDAIDWFIDTIMPDLLAKHPCELVLLGSSMPDRLRNMRSNGIIGKGFVEDLCSELQQSAFYIAPLFVGGGIRIKILEAMSAGLPVLASPIAAEGIDADRNEGLIICNTQEDFIREAQYLFDHPEECLQLGIIAHEFIVNNHSWDSIGKKFSALFNQSAKE